MGRGQYRQRQPGTCEGLAERESSPPPPPTPPSSGQLCRAGAWGVGVQVGVQAGGALRSDHGGLVSWL